LYRRLQTVAAMDVGLVLLMAAKPGFAGSLAIVAVAAVAGLLLSRAAWSRSTAVLAAGR
jgi:hypothetical protein